MSNTTNNHDKHIISLLVNNKPGVLIRISLVFSRRGYNIDSLVTHATHNPKYSMITITASGLQKTLQLIIKQLYKLVDVIEAKDRSLDSVVIQELAMIKCKFDSEKHRGDILHIANSLKCNIVDISNTALIFSCTGNSVTLDSLEDIFAPYGIIEIIRTGTILMVRGDETTA